ncbi:MAG: MFS transporter, partial [Candidatus Dormibacteraeota bacterium]|nr:MFS transporter [Candidatus Dormibacteraeota bacterium]
MRGGSSLWRHADFMRLWSGQTASMLGDHVTSLAVPTIAILLLRGNAWDLGLLTGLAALPYPLLAIPAGVLVDRLPKRPVMIGADCARLAVLASVPVAYLLHRLGLLQLDLVALASGACSTFFLAAYRAYLPVLVAGDQLIEGNARLEGSHAAAHLAGPGLGGPLIQAVGAPLAVVADMGSFVASVVGLAMIRRREAPAAREGTGGIRRSAAEGISALARHPVLARLAAAELVNNLGLSVGQAVYLLFAYRVLSRSPGQVGLILGLGGAAGIGGAMVAARLARRI